MRGMTLRQLRAFCLVARHRSFMQAAVDLHLTPSAVSLQIKDLERMAGLPLFDRQAKGVSLTPAGELLLVDAQQALHSLAHASDVMTRLRGRHVEGVTVGMVSNAAHFMPHVLAPFRDQHPDMQLFVSMGNREQLLEQLRRKQVDLAVMGEPPSEWMVNAQAFAAQPLGIVASPRHPRAMDRLIPVADLACEGFVVREPGSGTRAAMERFFRDARIHPPRTIEMASNEAIKQAVMAGMGMTFMSLHAAGSELQSRQLVALDVVGLPLLRRWHLVDAEPAQPSRASQLLRDFIVSRGGLEIERQFKDIGPNRHDRGPSLAAAA